MANATLKVENRTANKNPRQIRAMGFIPGSIYGKGMEAKNIQINTHDFELAYRDNNSETWELALGNEKFNAKIQELQKNYATNELLNIEFAVV